MAISGPEKRISTHRQFSRSTRIILKLPPNETRAGRGIRPDCNNLIPVVRSLDKSALDWLLSPLPILCVEMRNLEKAEPSDSLFSRLSADLARDMRAVWTPGAAFLPGLSRDDLMKAATECAITRKHPARLR